MRDDVNKLTLCENGEIFGQLRILLNRPQIRQMAAPGCVIQNENGLYIHFDMNIFNSIQ